MWIYVELLFSVRLNQITQGPQPWATLVAKLPILQRANRSSFLKAINQILPSSKRCSSNFGGFYVFIPSLLVLQTFLNPAIYLTELSASKLLYPDLSRIIPFSLSSFSIKGLSFEVDSQCYLPLLLGSDYSNELIASCVGLILWKYLHNPIQAYNPKLSHLFFCRFIQTLQQILASIPIPKQFTNPRLYYLTSIFTYLLSRISIIYPSQQILTFACQISNHDYQPQSHSSNLIFNYYNRFLLKLIGEPPHPRHLEKSFPVPMGMIQNVIWLKSMPYQSMMDTTHNTVPSPPQTTALTFPFPNLPTLS